jgi:hypothetical protein
MSGEQPTPDFLAAFGVQPTNPEPESNPNPDPNPAPNTEPNPNPEPEPNPNPDPNPEPNSNPEPNPKPEPTAAERQAYAFGQLRTENAKQKALLGEIAQVLGLPVDDNVAEAIKAKVLEVQAKSQNVPIQILQDLERLKERDAAYTAETLRNQALIGFQKVKDTFKLDDAGLEAFSVELFQAGLNPFTQSIDLVQEYKSRNFDRLIAQAREEGARQEAQRAAAANNNSSTPVSQSGGDQGDPEKINTVSDLNSFFDKLQG